MPKVIPRLLVSTITLDKLDGGLNLRDDPTEIAQNETSDCMNVTLDERGGAVSRLGLSKLNGASLLPQAPDFLYYSAIADALLAYISSDGGFGKLYKSTDGGATWSAVTTTFTAGAQAAIIDFAGTNGAKVVLVNTLDGVYSYPAALTAPTHTAGGSANMDEVRGSSIAVWQNKLWVTGDIREDATHSKARVWFSDAGTELSWTVASKFVDIRDVDTKACTAIGSGMGMDVTGKPSILVFKDNSCYRINDSASGSYTTLHAKGGGAASNKAVASSLGRICSINREGIWVTDGLAQPQRVSDKISPLFTPDGLNMTSFAQWSASPYRDRIVFNITRAGQTSNTLMLEYHPVIGWIVPHALSLSAMATYTKQTSKLISASSNSGKVFNTFAGGTDDGVNIPARWLSPWIPVSQGDEGRLRYIRTKGRGTISMQALTDFSTVGDSYTITYDQGLGFVWGVDSWNNGVWGNPAIEGTTTQALDQVCKYVAFGFSASTATSTFKPPLLGDGTSPETGAWANYGFKLDYVQLQT